MTWHDLNDPHNPENRNAGNGGDLVKHCVYATLLEVLLARPPWAEGMRLRECHAGRAIYPIDQDDPRRRLGRALRTEDNILLGAQRRVLAALRLPDDGSWYAGSAAMNATRLAMAASLHHYQGYEWAPDTRAIARAALVDAVGDHLSFDLPDGTGPDGRFEGERHIATELSRWDRRDVVLLDPFGLWRRPKLAERRRRYARLVEAYLCRGDEAPPLAWFFVWSHDEAGDDDMDGRTPPVADGYQALRRRVLDGGLRPLLVRWRWDLTCGIWLIVPRSIRRTLERELERNLGELARIATAEGVGPTRLEVTAA